MGEQAPDSEDPSHTGYDAGQSLPATTPEGHRELPVDIVLVQIDQVLLNLLQNAIDAIRATRGTGSREITVRVASGPGGDVRVSVHDTGKGIPDSVARRMFEPLFTTKKGGLGMGLAISRSIVEAHGGQVAVASRARGRRGTTLQFSLPLADGARRSRRTVRAR